MKHVPRTVIAALVLISMNAIFWLGFAVIAALGVIPGYDGAGIEKWLLVGLAMGTALCLALLAFFLGKRSRFAYISGVVLLGGILVLSITDQLGVWDILAMASILVALVLLLKDRKWYLGRKDESPGAGGGAE